MQCDKQPAQDELPSLRRMLQSRLEGRGHGAVPMDPLGLSGDQNGVCGGHITNETDPRPGGWLQLHWITPTFQPPNDGKMMSSLADAVRPSASVTVNVIVCRLRPGMP